MKSLSAILVILILISGIGNIMVLEWKESVNIEAAEYAFQKMFPGITDYRWEAENETFEVEIENGRKALAFDKKGNFLFQEKKVTLSDLPACSATYLSENFPLETITEISEITAANSNKAYEVDVNNHDLLFDSLGNFIGEEKEVQEESEDKQSFAAAHHLSE